MSMFRRTTHIIWLFLIFSVPAFAQDTTENIRLAFNAGSTKELIRYFNKTTEIKIDDQGSNYTIAQAEPVIRDFFKQNPPRTFEYIHKGESPQGLKYNIGQYKTDAASYRIVVFLKKVDDQYLIDTINFNKQ